jgi:hypothetical protein
MAPNWFVKFIGGFLPWVTKPFGEWFGKLLFYAIISTLMMMAYNRIFPTKPTTTIEKVETQIVNQCPEQDKVIGLHFNIWKLKIGAGI